MLSDLLLSSTGFSEGYTAATAGGGSMPPLGIVFSPFAWRFFSGFGKNPVHMEAISLIPLIFPTFLLVGTVATATIMLNWLQMLGLLAAPIRVLNISFILLALALSWQYLASPALFCSLANYTIAPTLRRPLFAGALRWGQVSEAYGIAFHTAGREPGKAGITG